MSNIVTDKNFCTENAVSTYSTSGVPLSIATVFTKTFTAISGYAFKTAPSINFSEVKNPGNYIVAINDTGSIANNNLTAREFVVKYKYPLKLVTDDIINFSAKAEISIALAVDNIYSFNIASGNILRSGEFRNITIFGDPGAQLLFDVKNASNSSIRGGVSTITIPSNSIYEESIRFPEATLSTSYSVVLTEINGSFLTMSSPQSLTIDQPADTTLTFRMTENSNDFLLTSGNITTSGLVGERSPTLVISNPTEPYYWAITSESSNVSMKNLAFTASDWTGTSSGGSNTLTGGSVVTFNNLESYIYPTVTAVSNTGSYTGSNVTFNGNLTESVFVGMRVTGTGITRSGSSSLLVTEVLYNPGPSDNTVVKFNQTVGGTVSSSTTITFHTAAHVYANIDVDVFGTSDQTCLFDVASIVAFNSAPTPINQTNVAASRNQEKEITLTATDPENDPLIFALKTLPSNGSLTYTNVQNVSTTVSCGDQSVDLTLGNSKVVTYTPSATGVTSLQFKVNDGQQDSSLGTITINVT